MKEDIPNESSEPGAHTGLQRSQELEKSLSDQRAAIARLCEEGILLSCEFSSVSL